MRTKHLINMCAVLLVFGVVFRYTHQSVAEYASTSVTLELAWTYTGEQTGCEMGSEVASAGDLNNDGFADVAISAPKGSVSIDREGVVYIFYGPVNATNPFPDVIVPSGSKGSSFGTSVSAGDVNCDGIDDLIVGAPLYKAGDEMPDAGKVYVYYGATNTGIKTTPDWTLAGQQREIQFGGEVAAGGDLNGDTCRDLAIGAPFDSNGELNEGRVYVYAGSPSGPVTATAQIFEVNQIGALFGKSISIAGDVDHDGIDDLLAGAPQYNSRDADDKVVYDAGAAFLYYGSTSGMSSVPDWSAFGAREDDRFGTALDTRGDINNDTYADAVISSPKWDGPTLDNEGRVQSYLGSASGLSATSWWYATGKGTNSNFGVSLSTAGDITGDGIDDLVVGAPYTAGTSGGTGQNEPESIFVFEGTAFGFFTNPSFTVQSNQSSTEFGSAVGIISSRSLNDVYSDIVVGAPAYMRDDKDKLGQAFVFLGTYTSGLAPIAPVVMFPMVSGQ